MDTEKIAKFLAELREDNNYTQYDLADILHIRRESVSKWERGVNIPSPDLLLKLSELYKVSVNELLLGERITKENEYKLKDLPVEILQDSHKRTKKIINRSIIIILLITLTFFAVFFINNYKSIKIYTVNSEDYKIKDGIILLSRDACYFKLGEIYTDEDYDKYRLYYRLNDEEKTLFIGNTEEITVDYNFVTEGEYNYSNILIAIENLYIDLLKDNVKVSTITLHSNRVYNNDKITYSKEEDSGDFIDYPDVKIPDYIKKHFKFDKDNNQFTYEEKKKDVTYNYFYAIDASFFKINEIYQNKNIYFEYDIPNKLLSVRFFEINLEKSNFVFNIESNICIVGKCDDNVQVIDRFKVRYLPMIKDRT